MLKQSFFTRIFGVIPSITDVARASEVVSDYNGAHLSMLPSIISNACKGIASREFKNAKSAFASILEEVLTVIMQDGREVDFHVEIAAKELILCHYYYPQICSDDKVEDLAAKLKSFNLL